MRGCTFRRQFWHPSARGFRLSPVWVPSRAGRRILSPEWVPNRSRRHILSPMLAPFHAGRHILSPVWAPIHAGDPSIACVGALPCGAAIRSPCRRPPALLWVCSVFRTKLVEMPTFSDQRRLHKTFQFFKAPFEHLNRNVYPFTNAFSENFKKFILWTQGAGAL